MKKLMILAVAMVAMAIGGKAEASLRLTLFDGTTTQVFFEQSNSSASVNFSYFGFTGQADLLTSNNPGTVVSGTTGLASLTQKISIQTGSLSGKTLIATLAVVDDVIGNNLLHNVNLNDGSHAAALAAVTALGVEKYYTLPGVGPATVRTSLSHDMPGEVDFVSGGKVVGNTIVNGSIVGTQTDVNIGDLMSGPGSAFSATVITGPFRLMNKVSLTGFTTDAMSGSGSITSITELRGSKERTIIPEPTSLALAGFAGIGMAVGAIRRRRQAKQAA